MKAQVSTDHYAIDDCKEARKIMGTIWDGYDMARCGIGINLPDNPDPFLLSLTSRIHKRRWAAIEKMFLQKYK